MKNSPTNSKLEELRRLKKIVDRRVTSRTADLKNANDALREEITNLKVRIEQLELKLQQERTESSQNKVAPAET
ncbi:MAG TPA: hypothetical protein VIB79_29980 [Candidatus Binatia bacterium]|jgi:C4-dicarboxylate-specific signal transduction histidine kinase